MPELTQSAFTSGELDPALYRRQNLAKFDSGLAQCENWFVHAHGGVSNRAGFEFVAEVKDHTKKVRLIEFEFNTEQTYILELGNQYMRFFKDNGQIVETATVPSAITQASPGVITDTAHPYADGDHVYVSGGDMTELTGARPYIIANKTANTYELTDLAGTAVDTTSFTAYTSGATVERIYEIATPWATADLFNIKFTQSADTMTLCHPGYAPRSLTRTGHTSWTLSTISFGSGIAAPTGVSATPTGGTGTNWVYVVTAIDEDTGAESVASSSNTASNATSLSTTNFNTITWTAVTGAASYNVYRQRGSLFAFLGSATGTSFKDDGITPDLDVSTPQSQTVFGATDEYPATTTYFKQRQAFAQTNNDPQRLRMSVIADFSNFNTSLPLKATDAINYRLVSRQVNEIRHLVPLDDLIILTSGGVWVAKGDDSGVVAPTTLNVTPSTYEGGASEVPPLIAGRNVLYIQARGEAIHDLGYKLEVDGMDGDDITILARHLFDNYTVTDWTFARVPYGIIWATRSDGTLLGLTYNRKQEVFAWHRHSTASAAGAGEFETVASVPEGTEDGVYTVVKRTIDGETRRYVERLHSRYISTKADAFIVDSGLSYSGSAVSSLSGLDHLEGETVNVLADGNILPQKTVTDGAITLGASYSTIHVGLPITATLTLLPVDVVSEGRESTTPRKKNATELTISVEDTTGLKAGKDASNLYSIKARQFEAYGEAAALKTDELVLKIGPEWGHRIQPVIQVSDPVPAKILAVTTDAHIGG